MSGNNYDAGIMQKSGAQFATEFFAPENQVVRESDTVVLVLMKSDEIDAIVEEIILKDGVKINPTMVVEDKAAYWWIKANGRIEIDVAEAEEMLGKRYSIYDVLVNVSSTIGRAYTGANTFTITSGLMGLDRKLEDVA